MRGSVEGCLAWRLVVFSPGRERDLKLAKATG